MVQLRATERGSVLVLSLTVLVLTVKGVVAKNEARGHRAKIALSIFGLRMGLSDTTLHAHDATALEKKRATANERDTHFCSRFGPSNLQNLTEGPQPVC